MEGAASAIQVKTVLVVGTFRSGTNVTAHCLAQYFHAEPVFNRWFWKHGLPPTGIQQSVPRSVPILVMSKHPVDAMVSFFRFWHARRPELGISDDFSRFLATPFFVYDNTGGNVRPQYRFDTPMAYWTQYYFAWQHWKDAKKQITFLRCEDIERNVEVCLETAARGIGLVRRDMVPITLPDERVGPEVSPKIRRAPVDVSDADRALIHDGIDRTVAAALGYG